MMKAQRVLVTDAGRASALAVIRSLGRAGHFVVAADSQPRPVGGRSRYANAQASYPSPFEVSADATATAIARLAAEHRIDVIIPVTDDVIVPLAHHRPHLPEGCTVAVASDDAWSRAASKVTTTLLAGSLGVYQARYEVIRQPSDAIGVVERLGSPVVIKPDRSRTIGLDDKLCKGSVSYAKTDAEAVDAIERCGQVVVAQALHPGVGHGIGMVLHEGRPLLAVQHRRVHEVPVSGGASARRETVPTDPALLTAACALLGELCWTGAAMVEFKVGPEGPAFLEINGRIWGSLPLAVRAGCDIPARMLGVHLGDAEATAGTLDTRYRSEVMSRNLDLELVWITSVLARGRSSSDLVTVTRRDGLAAARDLLRRGQGDDLSAPDDRRPVLTGVRHAVGHAVRKVRAHV